MDELRVALQDIQTLDQVDILLGIRLELLDDCILHFLVLACEALLTLALALVSFELFVWHHAVAVGAFESDVIEELAEELVHCLLLLELVAKHAFEYALGFGAGILRVLRLTVGHQALPTASGRA